jgi:hypothetical protein
MGHLAELRTQALPEQPEDGVRLATPADRPAHPAVGRSRPGDV